MAISLQPAGQLTKSPGIWSAAGLIQVANVVSFIVCVACNAASGNKNKREKRRSCLVFPDIDVVCSL